MLSVPKKQRMRRLGTATVEFAVIAPILVALTLGMIEITRAIQFKELLTDASRSGARLGAQPGVRTVDIEDNVKAILTANGLDPADATITVSVNGSSSDAKNAERNDKISVQVSVPISKINWVTPLFFSTTSVTSETVHMVRL
jgi:Flp pilus assembly protein TadG